jgi:hypothetical protein
LRFLKRRYPAQPEVKRIETVEYRSKPVLGVTLATGVGAGTPQLQFSEVGQAGNRQKPL